MASGSLRINVELRNLRKYGSSGSPDQSERPPRLKAAVEPCDTAEIGTTAYEEGTRSGGAEMIGDLPVESTSIDRLVRLNGSILYPTSNNSREQPGRGLVLRLPGTPGGS